MILVTTGSQKTQFDRLLKYIDESNINDEIIVQAPIVNIKLKKEMKILEFVDYEEMNRLIEEADFIITHGGTGSILTPLKMNKKIIACPRLAKYNEAIDDHQLDIVDIFYEEGYILKIDENIKLNDVLNKIKKFKPKKFKSNTDNFIKKLKEFIDE